MSVIAASFREVLKGQQSTSGTEGLRHQRIYKVACNAATDTTATVIAWATCPREGADMIASLDANGTPTYDATYFCQSSAVEYLGGAGAEFWFQINVTYQKKPTGWDANILNRVDKRGGGATTTAPVQFDRDGIELINSAGELFNPLPEWPTNDAQFTLVVRSVTLTPYLGKSWKTNSDVWQTFAIGTCLTGEISWVRSDAQDTPHWEITIPITYKADGHALELIDAGFNEVYVPPPGASAVANLVRIMVIDPETGERTEPTSPVPLDGNGQVLASGDPLVVGTFNLAKTAVFGAGGMALPNPVTL